MDSTHEIYMNRCLELARLGEGHTAPNPMVGCVIVHEGKIIGEGFHQRYGGSHAEVNAIRSVRNAHLLKSSILYVNLEPCSHFGKTPPCADLIIENKIPHIVIGIDDPNPEVAGQGIEKLKIAGSMIETNVLAKECRELNRRFFTCHEKNRPYIILKWAQTKDGFVDVYRSATAQNKPNWITDEIARIAVHKQRSTESAILIGTTTALIDNPSLTLRDWSGKQPLRIVFDMNHRLKTELNLFNGQAETLVISQTEYPDNRPSKYLILNDQKSVASIISSLHRLKVQSVIIEGGPVTLQHFIDSNYWDEAFVYTGVTNFGNGIKAPVLKISDPIFEENFKKSTLCVFRNQ